MTCHLLAEDIDRAEQHLAGAGDGKLRLREERNTRVERPRAPLAFAAELLSCCRTAELLPHC